MYIKSLIVTGYGVNCEEEVAHCFRKAGSDANIVHINTLIDSDFLDTSDILAFPGGFSYGDHIACGKNFANKLRFNILDKLKTFVDSGKPVIGICNGYQILVKLGFLPNLDDKNNQEFTFINNSDRGVDGGGHSRFEDRWVSLLVNKDNPSFWLNGVDTLELPVRHGEGRLVCPDKLKVKQLLENQQVAMYYATRTNNGLSIAYEYPDNPNGSLYGIAALTNRSGNVLGVMPHPEAYSLQEHYPHFLGRKDPVSNSLPLGRGDGVGMMFFYNAVKHARVLKNMD